MASISTLYTPLHVSAATEKLSLETLVSDIRGEDPVVRTQAWGRAHEVGAVAVAPLADLLTDPNAEVARAAKRGLWQIVRHSSRPGGESDRSAVEKELTGLLKPDVPAASLREFIWMISEIGTDGVVKPIGALLSRPDVRDDARMALERIPGAAALAELKSALDTAPEEFRPNIAHSLRVRGLEVKEYPSGKMVPVKPTQVQPLVPGAEKSTGEKAKGE